MFVMQAMRNVCVIGLNTRLEMRVEVVWVWFGEHDIHVPQITNTLLVLCTS